MKFGGEYWNPYDILPYQRHFNFINSIRSMGKTYSLFGMFFKRWLKNKEKFILLVRTVDEKKKGALQKWVEKVMQIEFPNFQYICSSDEMHSAYVDEKGKKKPGEVIGYCRALSEAVKIKKQTFVNVRWMCLEEYMLEINHWDSYVKGWNEPDLLLNIYHTVDRESDYVICFLLGNNTAFYNPYHMHVAFNIPPTLPGNIWISENVLFQNYLPNTYMENKKRKSKFLRMIKGTDYANYAVEGIYTGDNTQFIAEKSNRAVFSFSFYYNECCFGVWHDSSIDLSFVSFKCGSANITRYSLGVVQQGHKVLEKTNVLSKWLKKRYLSGKLFFETMEIKMKCEEGIKKYVV